MEYSLNAKYAKTTEPIYSPDELTDILVEDSAYGYRKRGSARRIVGRFDEAIADYDEALCRDPDNADLHRVKALTLHLMGDLDTAFLSYQDTANLCRQNGQIKQADDIEDMLTRGLRPLPQARA